MALVAGICPNCGKAVAVDPADKAAICESCKAPYIVAEALVKQGGVTIINNYQTVVVGNADPEFEKIKRDYNEYKPGMDRVYHQALVLETMKGRYYDKYETWEMVSEFNKKKIFGHWSPAQCLDTTSARTVLMRDYNTLEA